MQSLNLHIETLCLVFHDAKKLLKKCLNKSSNNAAVVILKAFNHITRPSDSVCVLKSNAAVKAHQLSFAELFVKQHEQKYFLCNHECSVYLLHSFANNFFD